MRFDAVPIVTFAAGECDFEIKEAEHRTAKESGNPMIFLKLLCTDNKGETKMVYNNLVATKTAMWKLHQFCEATNLVESYERGELNPEDCVGKFGKCITKIDPRSESGQLNIARYIKSTEPKTGLKFQKPEPPTEAELNDECPF